MSLKLKVHQISNPKQLGYPKWYSSVSYEKKVMDIDALAEHMSDHNTPYSKGVIKGILTDFVNCVREQALLGRKIRIDGLAIFKLGVSTTGADTFHDAKQRSMIKRVLLKLFPNGNFTSAELASAEIEWLDEYKPTEDSVTPEETPDTSGGSASDSGTQGSSSTEGSQTGTGTSDSGGGLNLGE